MLYGVKFKIFSMQVENSKIFCCIGKNLKFSCCREKNLKNIAAGGENLNFAVVGIKKSKKFCSREWNLKCVVTGNKFQIIMLQGVKFKTFLWQGKQSILFCSEENLKFSCFRGKILKFSAARRWNLKFFCCRGKFH